MNHQSHATRRLSQKITPSPGDVELLGNLAVIQFIGDDVVDAQTTIQHAIRLQPDDSVNGNVQAIIDAVVSGNDPARRRSKK